MNIVIGSGPAGIACASALLEKGKEVLVVDAGLELEPAQRDLLSKIKEGHGTGAVAELVAAQGHPKISGKGLLTKLVHGSDFPYRGAGEILGFEASGTDLAPSLAVGGFSNVWGSAVLPYRTSDIPDWPITAGDLAGHYEKVIRFTGLSATNDALAGPFPLYTDAPHHLEPSVQAHRLLQGLGRIQAGLEKEGIRYGSSRLMIGPSRNSDQACVYCGRCIYGCPYGCIYNSGDDLAGLLKQGTPGLRHRPNMIVTTVKENEGGVTVSGFDRLSREPLALEGERAFLAAGVVPSARIVLKSMDLYDTPVMLKDSQYFLFPLLSLAGDREALDEAKYTLSQVFIEVDDAEISAHTVHLQVYTHNDIITKTLEHRFRYLPLLRGLLARQLEHRILIVQGYLHSADSGKIRMSLKRGPSDSQDRLVVEGIPGARTRKVIGKVIKKLGRHLKGLGLYPIAAALEYCRPGRGFHVGGSFPMSTAPGPLETDVYGRMGGASRVHVVDASIFPSVPATTITLTAMANAHRIGSGAY